MTWSRLGVLAGLVVMALAVNPMAAYAQTPPGTSGAFSSGTSQVLQGGTINVTGVCLWGGQPSVPGLLVSASKVVNPGPDVYGFSTTLPAGAGGVVTGSLAVPANAPPGQYTLSGSCFEGDQDFFDKFGPLQIVASVTSSSTAVTTSTTLVPTSKVAPTTVDVEPTSSLPGGRLAFTGSTPTTPLLVGAGLIALGGLVHLRSRKVRRHR